MTTKLRQWRTDNDLALTEVAALTGYSVATVSRMERGTQTLRPLNSVRFARSLGVHVSVLIAARGLRRG